MKFPKLGQSLAVVAAPGAPALTGPLAGVLADALLTVCPAPQREMSHGALSRGVLSNAVNTERAVLIRKHFCGFKSYA